MNGPNYIIKRCQACGLVYQELPPDFHYINYDNLYQEQAVSIPIPNNRNQSFGDIFGDIQTAKPDPGSILEIGCSYGHLLAFFAERGWTATGIDRSSNAVHSARERGLDCSAVSLEDYSPPAPFDVIVMIHVLEHLIDPLESLHLIRRWLTPEGILYMRIPNVESSFVTKCRSNFLGHLKPFEHIFYYTVTTIEKLLGKAGYVCSVKLDGRYHLSDLINSKVRSKLVLNENWLTLNYKKSS